MRRAVGGREVEQRPDRRPGAVAGAELENLAEEDQDDDHRRRPRSRPRPRRHAGRGSRRERPRARAPPTRLKPQAARTPSGDQAEHVEPPAAERARAAHQERPAGPEDHRRREHQLEPAAAACAAAGPASAPWRRRAAAASARRPTDEAAPEVGELGVRPARPAGRAARAPCRRSGSRRDRRARSRGASGRCRSCPAAPARARDRCRAEKRVRVGGELAAAALGAEVIGVAGMDLRRLAGGGIDNHAADRVAKMVVHGIASSNVSRRYGASSRWKVKA